MARRVRFLTLCSGVQELDEDRSSNFDTVLPRSWRLNLRSVARAADAPTSNLHSDKLECGIRRGMYMPIVRRRCFRDENGPPTGYRTPWRRYWYANWHRNCHIICLCSSVSLAGYESSCSPLYTRTSRSIITVYNRFLSCSMSTPISGKTRRFKVRQPRWSRNDQFLIFYGYFMHF